MFDTVTDSFFLRFLMAALSVAIALGGFFGAVHYLRRTKAGSFLGAPRAHRNGRLQVLDQVAIDARRRLVLIRRDNVEHLLLIGGPQDVVLEQNAGARTGLPQTSGAEAFAEAADEDIWQDSGAQGFDFADEDQQDETYYADAEEPAGKTGLLGRLKLDRLSLRKPKRADVETLDSEPAISARFAEWEDADDYEPAPSSGPAQRRQDFAEVEDESVRLRGEPPTGTIRPLSATRQPERPVLGISDAAPPAPKLTPEEAAIARELEAARRRMQIPAPNASLSASQPALQQPVRPLPPASAAPVVQVAAPQQIGPSDFDRVLEQEMQEKLEAVRRPAPVSQPVIQVARVQQAPAQAPQTARPVVQQAVRRDQPLQRVPVQQPGPATMQSGMARIFGEDAVNQERRQ